MSQPINDILRVLQKLHKCFFKITCLFLSSFCLDAASAHAPVVVLFTLRSMYSLL